MPLDTAPAVDPHAGCGSNAYKQVRCARCARCARTLIVMPEAEIQPGGPR